MEISKERVRKILNKFKRNKDLFNWCEEYKNFINTCVCGCVSSEIDYILKKSYEDNDAPLSYEDLDLFDKDKAKENILYKYDEDEEELKSYANDTNTFNRRVKNKSDFEIFLNSLNKEELKDLCNNFGIEENDAEIYEWWIVSDPLKYRLEQEDEIFLENFWGRQTTGQSIQLDYCCINAFINLLKDMRI